MNKTRDQGINCQPKESIIFHDSCVELQGMPWYTIQGEGPFSGMPAVFVRFAGCNLQCPLCDTDYTSNRRLWHVSDIANYIAEVSPDRGERPTIIVITGGEPFRQVALRQFVQRLLADGAVVQIETNGTYYQELPWGAIEDGRLCVVCSPKAKIINGRIIDFITTLKYVLKAGEVADDGLPTTCLGGDFPPARPPLFFEGEVLVQPLDEDDPVKNHDNLLAAAASCLQHGYRLGVQLHKLANLE